MIDSATNGECGPLMDQRQFDEVHKQLHDSRADHDKHDERLRQLEMNVKVMHGDIESLRSSRHDHGNKLTSLEMAVSLLAQDVTAAVKALGRVEAETKLGADVNHEIQRQLIQIKADVRHALWLVGIVATGAGRPARSRTPAWP